MSIRFASFALVVCLLGSTSALAQHESPSSADYPAWNVVLVGHRGLSPGYPENTLAAFRNSIALGVDVIELDLRGTADGEVVVLHDETLDRTTDGSGPVTALTLAQIKALDAGSYLDARFSAERIPTYQEVLQLARGTGVKLLLDIKLSDALDKERIVRLTEQFRASLDVIVGVRSVEDLREFRLLNPNLRTLGFVPEATDVEAFVQAGVDMIRLWPEWIVADRDTRSCRRSYWLRQKLTQHGKLPDAGSASCLVQQVHELGRPVWTTAGEAARQQLDELIRLRVNGILTDVPEELAALLTDIEAQR
jgi:glycerophosphoryl diester phosphodiesterase